MRLINSVEAGLTNSAALEALLADGGRRAEMSAIVGMRGHARRLADAALTSSVLAGSPRATEIVFSNKVAASEFVANPIGLAAMKANRIAVRAASATENGLKGLIKGMPWVSRALPAVGTVSGMAYGAGLWVITAYANNGIYTSPDGVTWTQRTAGNEQFAGVVWSGTHFVAPVSGTGGKIYISADGLSWTLKTMTTTTYTTVGVATQGGVVVVAYAVAATGISIAQATDPAGAWTMSTVTSGGSGVTVYNIACGNGQWVISAVSGGVSCTYTVPTASLGGAWTYGIPSFSPGSGFFNVAFTGGFFVAICNTSSTVVRTADPLAGSWGSPVAASGTASTGYGTPMAVNGVLVWPLNSTSNRLISVDGGATFESRNMFTTLVAGANMFYANGLIVTPGAGATAIFNC
jgi:hypothetical protein